ncbi:DNA repair protein XRCC1 isoform X3 [Musca domestica]|uniref:DNA repair protein XRCC1 isoform X3 n=1 Tax=Musca domestica TaxID=7370 RepID=A0A1I8MH21_MUSDO|nr:DNA repair protein XRCC1 isoform X3 [Musca domestica]
MPFASFSRIREVSSEDDHHLAENLIKPSQGKKWKTKSVGEKSAYVILELDEAQQITGIDIGNEHSAFIEVLVGKSTSTPDDFTEILITCSFMTPIESRSSNNPNRVRCFCTDALVPSVAEKKWSLLKIICTQPFNKHVQYGLSFVKVHVASKNSTKDTGLAPAKEIDAKPTPLQIGMFKLREDSPDSETSGVSSLFNRWKTNKDANEHSAAASIRNAANSSCEKQSRENFKEIKSNDSFKNSKIEVRDRNRYDLMFGVADDTNTEKEARLAKEIEAEKERRRIEAKKREEIKEKEKRKSLDILPQHSTGNNRKEKPQTVNPHNLENEPAKKRSSSPNRKPAKKIRPSEIKYKPFNLLLKGVVLVISGIQNPDRADLRSKALALGAKYKSDWDNTCTHLICAFKNTPKYNQIKGKGKIVTRSWVEKCYNTKKYIPWRRFALDTEELTKTESDEEIFAESLLPSNLAARKNHDSERDERNETLSLYDLDEQPLKQQSRNNASTSSSENDTDDEINHVKEKNKHVATKATKTRLSITGIAAPGDIYDASTDEEEYLEKKNMKLLS